MFILFDSYWTNQTNYQIGRICCIVVRSDLLFLGPSDRWFPSIPRANGPLSVVLFFIFKDSTVFYYLFRKFVLQQYQLLSLLCATFFSTVQVTPLFSYHAFYVAVQVQLGQKILICKDRPQEPVQNIKHLFLLSCGCSLLLIVSSVPALYRED